MITKLYQYTKAGGTLARAVLARDPVEKKRLAELGYWTLQKAKKGQFTSDYYQDFYTDHFDIEPDHYEGKRILDIGCGPSGTLNWATMADQQIGLDPLVDDYKNLGISDHSGMEYITGRAENIPFPDDYFDVVASFNSLDHVDDLDETVEEIKRVADDDGLFLLITDVNHDPTMTEPVSFEWDVVEEFTPEFDLLWHDHREKSEEGVYYSARFGDQYDFSDDTRRYGVLSAKFRT